MNANPSLMEAMARKSERADVLAIMVFDVGL